jgi:hypothetical protein
MMSIIAAASLSDLFLVPSFAVSAAMLAQVVAVPTAWLKLRRTEVWAARPRHVRRLDLLVAFTARPVVLSAVFGGIVGLGVWIGMVIA